MATIWTIGHSNRTIGELIGLLAEHGVRSVLDVRAVPRSWRWPQFHGAALAGSLEAAGLGYRHDPRLGGLRETRVDSANTALLEPAFRAYADHMTTREFRHALASLLALAAGLPTAVLCAERDPDGCHRSLLADALLASGARVRHILEPGGWRDHALNPVARVAGSEVAYPGLC